MKGRLSVSSFSAGRSSGEEASLRLRGCVATDGRAEDVGRTTGAVNSRRRAMHLENLLPDRTARSASAGRSCDMRKRRAGDARRKAGVQPCSRGQEIAAPCAAREGEFRN